MLTAVILAGGKGTRLGLSDIPKPMVHINGIPLIERQILNLKSQGIRKIFLLCGYLGEKIFDHFLDGKKFGLDIHYIFDPYPIGTGGILSLLKGLIKEDFFVVYGDVYFDINLSKMMDFHNIRGAQLTAFVHPSSHIFDSDLVLLDSKYKIIQIYSKDDIRPEYYYNIGNAAFYIFSPTILENIEYGINQDFFKDVVPKLIEKKLSLFGYLSSEFIMDMGTPERKEKLESYFNNDSFLLKEKRPAIFLDRDGIINTYISNIHHISQIELIEGVEKAIKLLNQAGYLTVIVTNQPGIAKGFFTTIELEEMHKKIETLLSKKGAFIDRFYVCPHHPEIGFEGEIPELKIQCQCRKPNTGMLDQAIQDLNINKELSFIVGDSIRDMEAGKRKDLKTVFIPGEDIDNSLADYKSNSLLDFVENYLLKNRKL